MKHPINVRECGPRELTDLSEIYALLAKEEAGPYEVSETQELDIAAWLKDEFTYPESVIHFGAFIGNRLVGAMRVSVDDVAPPYVGRVVFFSRLYVLEEHRFSGAAEALVEAGSAYAKAIEADYAHITVDSHRKRPISYYRRLGFKAVYSGWVARV